MRRASKEVEVATLKEINLKELPFHIMILLQQSQIKM